MKKTLFMVCVALLAGCGSAENISGIYQDKDKTAVLEIKKIGDQYTADLGVAGPEENTCAGGITGPLNKIKEGQYELTQTVMGEKCVVNVSFKDGKVSLVENSESCRSMHGALCDFNADALVKQSSEPTTSTNVAPKTDFSDLKGKHPYSLFADPKYGAMIKTILQPGVDVKFISSYFDVSSGMQKEGNFWVGQGCVPHLCTSNEGFVALNEQTGKIFLITADVDDKKATTEFTTYGTDILAQGNSGKLSEPYPASLKKWFAKFSFNLQ